MLIISRRPRHVGSGWDDARSRFDGNEAEEAEGAKSRAERDVREALNKLKF